MLTDAVTPVPPPAEVRPPSLAVKRAAFYLCSQGQWLFAWLHRPERGSSDHAVLVCPPLGHEQVLAHRSLRHLADAVAGAGLPVLRLDYHGTGDSAGTDEDPDRLATWLANLRDARRWLQEQLGCRRVTLVGLRLGAALAVQAADVQAVDGLVLWAPVVKGRGYVRELKALSLTGAARPGTGSSGDIEAGGFVLSEQTAQEVGQLDLLKCHPRCRRALIVARDDIPVDAGLLAHLTALGIQTKQAVLPGYPEMMAEPHSSQLPREVIRRAVDWLLADKPCDSAGAGATFEERSWPTDAVLPSDLPAGSPTQPACWIRERVLQISEGLPLVGILSEPGDAPPNALPNALPFLVLLNAGACYRVGPGRLYVSLSRHLAAQGFRCLRVDLCGLGDSVSAGAAGENDPYPATAFQDIDLVLRYLRTQVGAERAVLVGLCSGAYAAFQSAARLPAPCLAESVLINPLTFHWSEGMSLEASPAKQLEIYRACLRALWQPAKWWKLLSGRANLGAAAAVGLVLGRLWPWRLAGCTGPIGTGEGFPLSHPEGGDLPGDLRRIALAGRHLACFFSRSDPGYALLTHSAPRQVKELCGAGKMSVSFIEEADHTFTRRESRRILIQAINEHLTRRYLSGSPSAKHHSLSRG